MTDNPRVRRLYRLLQQALEIELFTIPPYLTALYSIKDGANVESAKIIRSVVMEEMLHATLVANIMNAVGAKPLVSPDIANLANDDLRILERDYASRVPHINLNICVHLSRFSASSIRTFRTIEEPEDPREWLASIREGKVHSIGHLYQLVLDLLVTLVGDLGERDVFSGNPMLQIGTEQYYGGGGRIIAIRCLSDAKEAITEVAQQGEGRVRLSNLTGDQIRFKQPREVAHFYRFEEILAGRYYDADDDVGLHPSGPELRVDWSAVHDTQDDPPKGEKSPDGVDRLLDAFDRAYRDLLRCVHRGFNGEPDALRDATIIMHKLKQQCIGLMRVEVEGGRTCGPPFFYVQAVSGCG